MTPLPTWTALRYVQPLREGGSLPAVVETDGGLFVMKFRGAGQGPRALIAELIVGLLANHLGLQTPELAILEKLEIGGASLIGFDADAVVFDGEHGLAVLRGQLKIRLAGLRPFLKQENRGVAGQFWQGRNRIKLRQRQWGDR